MSTAVRRGPYRSMHSALIHDSDFRALQPNSKLVFVYLKLQLGPSGIDVFYWSTLIDQVGLTADEVAAALGELEAGDWIRRQDSVIWIRNGLRFEPQISLDNTRHRTAIENHLAGLPRLPLVDDFCRYYGMENPNGKPPASEEPQEPEPEGESGPDPLEEEFREFCGYFEETAGRQVREFPEKRRRAYRARRKNWSDDELRAALAAAADDDFLRGQNDSGKDYLTLDYLLRPDITEKWVTIAQGARAGAPGSQLLEEMV